MIGGVIDIGDIFSASNISLPTPENEKSAKIQSISVKCTQRNENIYMKTYIPQNLFRLMPVLFTPLINIHL